MAVQSFEAIYRQYFDFVWSCARRLGVGAEAVDDVVQEVFVVVHAKLSTLENQEALRSWLYGIVRRVSLRHHRTRRHYTASMAAVETETLAQSTSVPTPAELTESAADAQLCEALLAQLDEPKREILALVEIESLSVPEAAQALEIPLNTAYSRLRVARQEFEAALARHAARQKGASVR